MRLLVCCSVVALATGCGARTGLPAGEFEAPSDATAETRDATFDVPAVDVNDVCPGTVCDGVCVDLTRDVHHCGACNRDCPVPSHAVATCNAGVCGFVCESGYMLLDGACVVPPPRPLTPSSTSTVTSLRPTLRWQLPAGVDDTHVELCTDRACAVILSALEAKGTSVRVPSELPSGPVFFRLSWRVDGKTVWSPTWEFFVGHRDRGVDASSGTTLDLNGDGYPDLATVFSNTYFDDTDSRVAVYLGTKTGPAEVPTLVAPGLRAASSYDVSAVNAGDVNGDGYGDLVVAEPAENRVHLFLGGPSGPQTTPSATIKSPLPGDFGLVVGAAGDVDGDGYADVIVRRDPPPPDTVSGRADLFRGGPSGLTFAATLEPPPSAPNLFYRFAASFASADVNADGYSDVVVGATFHDCRAYVYLGSASGLPASPSVTLIEEIPARPAFGASVATSDVNGDGFADVAISRVGIVAGTGGAYVYLGNATGIASTSAVFLPAPSDSEYDTRVAAAGDLNGDGYDELLLGWPNHSHSVAVYAGSPAGLSTSRATSLGFPGPWNWFGAVLARTGDLNGDGYGDIAILGRDTADIERKTKGKVHLFRGSAAGIVSSPWRDLVLDSPLTGLAAGAGP